MHAIWMINSGKERGNKNDTRVLSIWKEAAIRSLGEDVRVVRGRSRYDEESEWSLMITLLQDVLSRESVDRVFHDVIERCASRRSRDEAMPRGGSFDQWSASLEVYAEWKKCREDELSSTGQIPAASGTRTRRPSILESNLVPTRV